MYLLGLEILVYLYVTDIAVECVDLDDLHGEDGSHDAMCNLYHGSVGVAGSDMDASLVWLSSCDWRYVFLVYIFLVWRGWIL